MFCDLSIHIKEIVGAQFCLFIQCGGKICLTHPQNSYRFHFTTILGTVGFLRIDFAGKEWFSLTLQTKKQLTHGQ